MKRFIIKWFDGTEDIVEGENIVEAYKKHFAISCVPNVMSVLEIPQDSNYDELRLEYTNFFK